MPAVHKLRTDVARVFGRTIGTDPKNSNVPYLAESQRQNTRPYYLKAEAGMTGANFAIAETGSVVVCTNEGNADLSVHLPKLHVASIGIEKIIPRIEHLGVFVRLLSRSALGSPITQLTSHFRAPRDGAEMHIVLVDNGRSERLGMADFWYSLKCIRCGACLNTCPVYRRSGGLSYGSTYSGPIGVIIDPTFNLRKYSSLPFASTLNGSCTAVCPVKINIHEQIYKWRQIISERGQLPIVKKEAMKMAGKVLASPTLYRTAVKAANAGLEYLPRTMIYNPLQRVGSAARSAEGAQDVLSATGISRAGGRRSEQPRRDPGARAQEPAGSAAAAGVADVRSGPAFAGRRVQGQSGAHGWQRSSRRLPTRISTRSSGERFPDAKVVCSAAPEVAGNRPIDRVDGPGRARRRRRGRRASGFRRRRNRLGLSDRG